MDEINLPFHRSGLLKGKAMCQVYKGERWKA